MALHSGTFISLKIYAKYLLLLCWLNRYKDNFKNIFRKFCKNVL